MAFLELANVRKEFGSAVAVQNFNLNVERGEFVSFLGTSGCGKTTTLRMIAGFEIPTQGTIKINGTEITNVPPNKRNVGMVFQSYALFPHMSVNDNIGFGLKIANKPASEIKARVDEMLQIIGLPQMGTRYPHQLSGGQQQRVALARALAVRPQVLLLDEPLSALDAKIRVSLREEIRAIQRRLGITTVYVTHDQEEAMSLSDRVVVMSEGRIEQVGTPFEIYNFPGTAFVASFVGTLNTLHGTLAEGGNDVVMVSGQPVKLSQPVSGKRAGEGVILNVRPEQLQLNRPNAENQIHGIIETVTFLGAVVRVMVKLQTGELEVDLFNNPHLDLPEVGAQVSVGFDREAVRVM